MLTSYSGVDGWIMVWNVQSGQLLWRLKAALLKPDTPVQSPAGIFVATGEKNFELREPESGKVLWSRKQLSATPERVASPDRSMVAELGSYGDASVRIYDGRTRQLIRRLEGHPGVILSLAYSPDGKLIASAGRDKVIRFWNAQTGALVRSLFGHTKEITSIAFSGDGKRLVSGGPDDTIRIWNVEDGTLVRSFMAHGNFPEGTTSVTLSHDGKIVAGAAREHIKLWEAATGKQIGTLTSGESQVSSLMFSPDDELIVSGYEDSTIKLWNVKHAKLRRVIKGRFKELHDVVFSPDGRFIAAGYNTGDTRVEIWSVQSGRLVTRFGKNSDYVESLAFSRKGNMIATGHFWDDVRVWNAKTGRLMKSFKQPFSEQDRVAFSPDGRYVASAGWNQNVLLWNVQQGKVTWSVLPLDWETEKALKARKADEPKSTKTAR